MLGLIAGGDKANEETSGVFANPTLGEAGERGAKEAGLEAYLGEEGNCTGRPVDPEPASTVYIAIKFTFIKPHLLLLLTKV